MKFSIIIPVYNRPQELRRALQSCLSQTYTNFEIIVVDDCSTEDVGEVCRAFDDGRIRFVRNDHNLGASGSRNHGLDLASGDYVSFLDSDDLFLPGKLDAIYKILLETNADIALHPQYRVFSDEGETINFEIMPKSRFEKWMNIADFIFRDGNFIQTNTFTLRRDFVGDRRFDGKYKLWDDTQFIIDCCTCSSHVVFVDYPLSVFFDYSNLNRVSQRRELVQHVEMLAYLETQGFERAAKFFRAMAVSDAIFYHNPLKAIRHVLSGFGAGVSLKRSIFYLARCVLGFGRMKTIATYLKGLQQYRRQSRSVPIDLASALNQDRIG